MSQDSERDKIFFFYKKNIKAVGSNSSWNNIQFLLEEFFNIYITSKNVIPWNTVASWLFFLTGVFFQIPLESQPNFNLSLRLLE